MDGYQRFQQIERQNKEGFFGPPIPRPNPSNSRLIAIDPDSRTSKALDTLTAPERRTFFAAHMIARLDALSLANPAFAQFDAFPAEERANSLKDGIQQFGAIPAPERGRAFDKINRLGLSRRMLQGMDASADLYVIAEIRDSPHVTAFPETNRADFQKALQIIRTQAERGGAPGAAPLSGERNQRIV